MTPLERRDAARIVLGIARDAARVVGEHYARPFAVEYKSKDDPVTAADRAANDLICGALLARFPGMPIVAEESDPRTYAGYAGAEAAWFVDPLDGTRDFVKKNGEFVVMIGLAEAGRATLGVLVVPVTGEAYVGGNDVDAVAIDALGRETPLRVSQVASLADAELVVSRSRRVGPLDEAARKLGVQRLTPCGSAGLKAARVASGRADAYLQPSPAGKLWDACAPEAVVVAAGGRVTDTEGRSFDYRSPELALTRGFVATNAALHASALGLLRDAEARRG